ncbi:MAG: hypothetical protein ACFFCS_30035 [Candidatus Hodarchaeota archaeon]
MSFAKGFITTILLYFGLTLVFAVIAGVMASIPIADVFNTLFSGIEPIAYLLYSNLAIPTINLAFSQIVTIFIVRDYLLLVPLLGMILPPALAAIIGAFVAKKSGTVKTVFSATFGGLLLCSVIGVILQVIRWPAFGVVLGLSIYPNWEWFLPAALIMTAFNAFFWSAVGLLLTRKTWD